MESCMLVCLQKLHDPIPLPDNTPVRLGRSPQTQITEARCSRLQVEVQVSLKTKEIKVTQLGSNTSAIDGRDLQRGETVPMSANSTLFILKGYYPHKVVFKGMKKPAETSQSRVQSSSDSAATDSAKGKVKRSADDMNGVTEDNSPAKKRKTVKSNRGKDSPSGKEPEARSSPNKSRELNKQCSDNEKKAEDHSKDRKPVDHSGRKERDSQSRTDKQKLDSKNKHKVDQDSQSRKNKVKLEVKSESRTERKSSSDSKTTSSKASRHDLSDEEEDTHVKTVSEKLQQLKQKAKSEKVSDKTGTSSSSKSATSSGEKRKSSTDLIIKSKECRTGKPASDSTWMSQDDERLYIFTSKGAAASEKIAGFDIDGTIITTKSGRVFAKDMDDWRILMPEVFGKLKHLIAAGYKIVFFTNQLGVGRGKVKIKDLQDKFEKVVYKLQIPVQIFISTSGGSYRKPAMGMWQILKKHNNDGIPVNVADSFYVGDAAGRQANWAPKKKKDFSCSDRLFALNIGLRFHTPEEFFLGHKAALFELPDFDPRNVSPDAPLLQGGASVTSDSQEVVVLVGFQASGKSTFAQAHLIPQGYMYINQDTLKTWQKCVSECSKALAAGKKVVIDNTNLDPESRARYIECARKAGVPCRCFFFDFSVSHCRHNERFREMMDKEHKPINEMIFHSAKKRFKAPEAREGFSKVVKVNFVPQFSNKIHKKVYCQFLLEK